MITARLCDKTHIIHLTGIYWLIYVTGIILLLGDTLVNQKKPKYVPLMDTISMVLTPVFKLILMPWIHVINLILYIRECKCKLTQ